jgi:ADP-ribosylglycohydrolase
MKQDAVKDALLGVAVGDAVGVPVEFMSRETLMRAPVIGMRGFGTHQQPPGTWSDDSSMTFCLAEMLCGGYDLDKLARHFVNWKDHGYWAAYGRVFDIGIGTSAAIFRLKTGTSPAKAGGIDEGSNGNGSLMRILPLLFHIADKEIAERFELVREVSALTHRHTRSAIACFIYLELALEILQGREKRVAYGKICGETKTWLYRSEIADKEEMGLFYRILSGGLPDMGPEKIYSSGYVLHTLEAAIWCLLTTHNYREAVLKAVNLGEDTDTTAAVAGGLAGLAYGWETIPSEWLGSLARRGEIESLCERLTDKTRIKWQEPM